MSRGVVMVVDILFRTVSVLVTVTIEIDERVVGTLVTFVTVDVDVTVGSVTMQEQPSEIDARGTVFKSSVSTGPYDLCDYSLEALGLCQK